MSALPADLRYVTDARPGLRRRRFGRGFRYVGTDGKPVRDPAELARIRSLAIPPAWTNVWICPAPDGHLQATGRDARGRKQYRYHPRWHEIQGSTKFDRLLRFAKSLPRLRRSVRRDLRLSGLPRARVLALLVRLLDVTALRIGNDEYARSNGSFGLTTLRNRHARVNGSQVQLEFRGKSGVQQCVQIDDRRLARLVRRCQELPGQELFCYLDDENHVQSVESADVNDYVRRAAGEEFSAKDFRTWYGTLLAWEFLTRQPVTPQLRSRQQTVRRAIAHVAEALGNTCAVCRKYYIHPALLDAFAAGTLPRVVPANCTSPRELKSAECSLLHFLQRLEKTTRRTERGLRSEPVRLDGNRPIRVARSLR
jgi:DNA topoisomerase-1